MRVLVVEWISYRQTEAQAQNGQEETGSGSEESLSFLH